MYIFVIVLIAIIVIALCVGPSIAVLLRECVARRDNANHDVVTGGARGGAARARAKPHAAPRQAKRTKSEALVVAIIEELTGDKFPTAHPTWLRHHGKTLELDGYCARRRLALEFQGPLHTKWFPEVEAYDRYFERVSRDAVKLRVCKQRGVELIVVDMSLPREHWRNYIASRLADLGVADRPVVYVERQTAEPYRNEQIERELGLTLPVE